MKSADDDCKSLHKSGQLLCSVCAPVRVQTQPTSARVCLLSQLTHVGAEWHRALWRVSQNKRVQRTPVTGWFRHLSRTSGLPNTRQSIDSDQVKNAVF
jgi:hypothetical protein